LYWQIAKANLSHLFERPRLDGQMAESRTIPNQAPASPSQRYASVESNVESGENQHGSLSQQIPNGVANEPEKSGLQPISRPVRDFPGFDQSRQFTHVSAPGANEDKEVIIIVRSKSTPQLGESITIPNPSHELIQYLSEMRAGPESRSLDLARMRRQE
jgi:hypothetical protein